MWFQQPHTLSSQKKKKRPNLTDIYIICIIASYKTEALDTPELYRSVCCLPSLLLPLLPLPPLYTYLKKTDSKTLLWPNNATSIYHDHTARAPFNKNERSEMRDYTTLHCSESLFFALTALISTRHRSPLNDVGRRASWGGQSRSTTWRRSRSRCCHSGSPSLLAGSPAPQHIAVTGRQGKET